MVVTGFSLGRRGFGRLRALCGAVRVGCPGVMVLLVVMMGVGLLLVAWLLALPFLLLLVVFLLLFQSLFALADAHELDRPLLSTHDHCGTQREGRASSERPQSLQSNAEERVKGYKADVREIIVSEQSREDKAEA